MLKQRVLTALVGLPLILLLLVNGPLWALIPLFMVFVSLATYETAAMLAPRLEAIFTTGSLAAPRAETVPEWLVPAAVAFAGLIFLGASIDAEDAGRGMVLLGVLGSILLGAFAAPSNELAFGRIVCLLVSIAYGSFPWLATWELLVMGEGSRYVILLLAVVWAGDTGAYFGGRRFGKHKLAPRMSPKKTWEGAISGLIASLLGGVAANLVYGGSLASWPAIILASVLGGAFGQMGDLVESTFKRFAGVKDSGIIFPGHGGFLDRVDGLLFAAPVIWFILYSLSQS